MAIHTRLGGTEVHIEKLNLDTGKCTYRHLDDGLRYEDVPILSLRATDGINEMVKSADEVIGGPHA